ncbi:MoaD/ThiS family protein [Candidatus Woesearchaeota archaeon]|nr:MoaD/ThiS family protein [Candidatus Woesearchaeota archaeon]
MIINIQKNNRKINKDFSGKVIELLTNLKINPETVLVTRNNELLTEEDNLENKDEIHVLSVISGG